MAERLTQDWTYYGVNVHRLGRNSSGLRWGAFAGVGRYLRADTKASMRELIRHERGATS